MKKGKIFTNCFLAIFTLLVSVSFASCSADSEDTFMPDNSSESAVQVEAPFSVILKAYSDNQDVTAEYNANNTTLFVFDENNDFHKQITVDKTYFLQVKPVEISCAGSKKITVIAWAGTSDNTEVSQMNQANIISDLQVSLKQNNGVVRSLPTDLFYGQITINRPTTKTATQELKVERKVSSVFLSTKGVLKVYDSKEGEYFYKVKNTKSTFDSNGELIGNDVEYIIPATFNKDNNLVSETTTILPNDNISIELYKDGEMILSSEKVQNSKKVTANAGEQLNLSFDLSRNNFNILVSDWNTVIQVVTIG